MTSTESSESFQITAEVAESYESALVPAFFAQWAPRLCAVAGVADGDRVLDVGCGTGIVARTAAKLVGATGRVIGVDRNPAMLQVARRVQPDLTWQIGDATALPMPDDSFDVVLSQMALMFFPDRSAALHQMRRVVCRGGSVALLVPAELALQAAFAPFVEMAGRHAGPGAMSLLGSYFDCGDLDALCTLVVAVGLDVRSASVSVGRYRASSVEAFVRTEVESTPLAERLSQAVYARIRTEAAEVLAPFTTADGSVDAPFSANLVVGRRS